MKQFPRHLDDGTPYISHSQIRLLLTCPAKYRKKYLEEQPDPMGLEAIIGIAAHTGFETILGAVGSSKDYAGLTDVSRDNIVEDAVQGAKTRLDELLPTAREGSATEYVVEAVLRDLRAIRDRAKLKSNQDARVVEEAWFRRADGGWWPVPVVSSSVGLVEELSELSVFEACKEAVAFLAGKAALEDGELEGRMGPLVGGAWDDRLFEVAAAQLRALVSAFSAWWLEQDYEVVAVESEVVGMVTEEVASLGYVDAVVRDRYDHLVVLDWKTVKQMPSEAKPEHVLQLARYTRDLEPSLGPIHEARIIYITREGEPRIYEAPIEQPGRLRDWVSSIDAGAINTIRGGVYAPNPVGAGNLCSAKFCAYYGSCEGSPGRITK